MTPAVFTWVLTLCVTGASVCCGADPQGSEDEAKAKWPEAKPAITGKPMTAKIELSPRLQSQVAAALMADPPGTVRLTIHGVVPPERRQLVCGVNVFLNKTDATASTPTDDIHFVWAFDFSPTTDGTPQSFHVDLSRTLVALKRQNELDLTEPLAITLVAVPADRTRPLPDDFAIWVREMAIRVPTPKSSR
jgi:hypothetical protein